MKHSLKETTSQTLRRNFLYGMMVILPIFATVWLVHLIIQVFSGPISSLLGSEINMFISFFLTLIVITSVGFFARNFIGKAMIDFLEGVVTKVPIVNKVYQSTKQIIHAFSVQDSSKMQPVMVEYPRKGIWAMGFLTNDSVSGYCSTDGRSLLENKVAVFLPTTPNPTSGFFLFFDRSEIVYLDLPTDESIKIMMCAGVINPK